MQYENHHIRPVAIYGEDIPENIARITSAQHREIHDTLVMPCSKIRGARKQINGRPYRDEYAVHKEFDVLRDYFMNLGRLDNALQSVHFKKMKDMESLRLKQLSKEYKGLTELLHSGAIINQPQLNSPLSKTNNFTSKLDNVEQLEVLRSKLFIAKLKGQAQVDILDILEKGLNDNTK